MKIGVMLRSIDETGGIGIYSRNIVGELLQIDPDNEYVLFYRTPKYLGRYSQFPNAKEKVLKVRNKIIWDQVAVPRAVASEKVDVLFHPKFTVPLFTTAKTVMTVHGADWFIPPYDQVFNKSDVLYIKSIMPLYFRKADFVLSVSDYSTDGFIRRFPEYSSKIKTVYFGPNKVFRKIYDKALLDEVRHKYNLPERFILTVIRYDHGTKNLRKNFGTMLQGYYLSKSKYGTPHKFVVVGKDCHLYGEDYSIKSLGLEDDVIFPGLVSQEDLPAFYNLADLYLYPTLIEAFPIPTTEAMASGCPIVTSHDTGLRELTDGAAVHVDPKDPNQVACAINQVLTDGNLRQRLITAGLERSKMFSWEKCARETLAVLERVGNSQKISSVA